MKDEKFLQAYTDQVSCLIESARGKKLSDIEISELKSFITSESKDQKVSLINTDSKTKKSYSLKNAVSSIIESKPILTGNGTLFRRLDKGGHNTTGSFLESILSSRKQVKKKLFELEEKKKECTDTKLKAKLEEDANRLDMRQKVFKVLANA
jgi:hypothetical protein